MHIDLHDAIKIYAKASRTRYGAKARDKMLETAKSLRASGDQHGAAVWEQVATEVERGDSAGSPARDG
jgi:hypothetical protein